ncbi:hypothetical protein sphantq_03219 [Sphingobium sp. AntQ-1]|nr:hypothetical protein sphantq_03219 [Sphingobium sp. AntQ-1]
MQKATKRSSSGFSWPLLWGIALKTMSKPEDSAPSVGADAAQPTVPAAEKAKEKDKVDLATAAIKSAGKGVWAGAAVGIGSAAIVAALLYTRRKG